MGNVYRKKELQNQKNMAESKHIVTDLKELTDLEPWRKNQS